jgi:2-oxo-4-hydroxy-4-carboxy-5-ureidoimidazoline decarboxylase
MVLSRPFQSAEDLYSKGESIWKSLEESDWKEAFAHHPRIGRLDPLHEKFSSTRTWAQGEQSGTALASNETLDSLAASNIEYEQKFGYMFIVCATGKSAEEMQSILKERLQNHPDIELQTAAKEQAKITRLRLEKLLRE